MVTPEQSKAQDEYLAPRHARFATEPSKVLIDARELINYVANMDFPEWVEGNEAHLYDMLNRIIDLIDFTATLDNPGLPRGWMFSWRTAKGDGSR